MHRRHTGLGLGLSLSLGLYFGFGLGPRLPLGKLTRCGIGFRLKRSLSRAFWHSAVTPKRQSYKHNTTNFLKFWDFFLILRIFWNFRVFKNFGQKGDILGNRYPSKQGIIYKNVWLPRNFTPAKPPIKIWKRNHCANKNLSWWKCFWFI